MPAKRIELNGVPLNYTCENSRFKTNVQKGYEHYTSGNKGSVTVEPLCESDGYTLWIEHVVDKTNGNECYWFMWYDPNMIPTIPMSGVMDADDLVTVIKNVKAISF